MTFKIFLSLFSIFLVFISTSCQKRSFNAQNAFNHIQKQVEFGPRIPGSKISIAFQRYLIDELEIAGWGIEEQQFTYKDVTLSNIIAKSSTKPPDIILGTHYDTRAKCDQEDDPSKRGTPVIGANDGASGTAILLELARIINKVEIDIWLVFFDAEDQGGIDDWEWSIGAQHFAENLHVIPNETIIIDMVGDKNLEIFKEINSSSKLNENIWQTAFDLGYEKYFINQEKYAIINDHQPFIDRGIHASLIIDMDYEHWHTTQDIITNVSQNSLEIVGNVLLSYLEKYHSY